VVGEPTGAQVSAAWTRRDLVALADRMLAAAQPFASPGHGRITLPGSEGGYGRAVDGLEGFARTFLLAGFRIAGDPGAPAAGRLLEWYAEGIAAGTDPSAPDRWVRLPEHGQAKVEAASIALILDLTRPWLWDRLDSAVQQRVVEYLAPAVGDDTYPQINWVWFRLVVQTFLRSVGGPFSLDEMAADLATHDTFAKADGWMSDGAERSYDHYVGWALHLYPALWARMAGAQDLAAPRHARDVAALDRFLQDFVSLVGADGSPLIQGRSLIYRFAAAAPFWVGALAGVPSLAPGLLRRAATGVIGHFVAHGAFDEHDLLTLGWHAPWPRLAQSYSGPGSPYWASKGMLGLALPADHPVWTDEEQPLPVQRGDVLRAVRAPGWLVSGTVDDGIVRVVNHGTDHTVPGATITDSPLYARLGYSTATAPVLDESGWTSPVDQTVALVDAAGRPTHRAGMTTLFVDVRGGSPGVEAGVAASRATAHWVDDAAKAPDHGSGRIGTPTTAGQITVLSVVRGPWEARLVRVDQLADGVQAEDLRLRIGGWPVAGEAPRSSVLALIGEASAGSTTRPDGGPLGGPVRVPWVDFPVRVGAWVAVLVELTGAPGAGDPSTVVIEGDSDLAVRVDWPDGASTQLHIEL
jgi:hypothetical protein